MSNDEYIKICGDDLCFEAVLSGRIFAKEAFGIDRYTNTNKGLYPLLRYVAAKLESIFQEFQPDFVSISNGFTPLSQIALSKAYKFNVSPIFIEAPLMPGAALVIDPVGPYFMPGNNWFDRSFNLQSSKLDTTQKEQASALLNEWRFNRKTKINIKNKKSDLCKLKDFVEKDSRPTLLLGLQVVRDMSVVFNLPSTYNQDYREWVKSVIENLPRTWKLVIKRHPKCWYLPHNDQENIVVIDAVNIHDAIELCDCTMVLCSNVGLESILLGKPTITGGVPQYSRKGLTLDMHSLKMSSLPKTLDKALKFGLNTDKRLDLIYELLIKYQFWPNDDKKFLETLNYARKLTKTNEPNSNRKPFYSMYPQYRKDYIDLLVDYNALLKKGVSRGAAKRAVLSTDRFARYKSLFSLKSAAISSFHRRIRSIKQSLSKRLR
jgi:hypothetical protein